MPDYSKYKWQTSMGEVRHGGAVGAVTLDTSLLDEMIGDIEDKISDILLDIGDETAMDAARLAPVDTGDLSDSYLSSSDMLSPTTYRVQDGVMYGIFQELGTSKMAAQPHLIPAVEGVGEKWEQALEALFK